MFSAWIRRVVATLATLLARFLPCEHSVLFHYLVGNSNTGGIPVRISNPVIPADFPDPDVIHVNDIYIHGVNHHAHVSGL